MTGGSNSGIMKIVGDARARFNPKAPLIGITGLGTIAGGERLRGIDILKDAGSRAREGGSGTKFGGGFEKPLQPGSGFAASSSDRKGWQLFGYDEGVFCAQKIRLQRHFYCN